MKNPVEKICAVHDLSGFGRCALSVIIPTLSVMGFQVCSLPTATLSTHTGGFENFVFRDLTCDMEGFFEHWKEESVEFKAFYSGFLGNERQIDIVEKMIKSCEKDTLIFVDPVMGDDGELYSTYTEEMRRGVARLVRHAHVITPNTTEAAFLLDRAPMMRYTVEEVEEMVLSLTEICSGSIAVTGVEAHGEVGCAYYEKGQDKVKFYMHKKHEKSYPGTGDIFASVLLGRIMKKDSLSSSVKHACDFIDDLVGYSKQFDYPVREGVLLESRLSVLLND